MARTLKDELKDFINGIKVRLSLLKYKHLIKARKRIYKLKYLEVPERCFN